MSDESRDPELEWIRRDCEVQPPTVGFRDRVLESYVQEADRVRATRRKPGARWMVAFVRLAAVTLLAGAVLLVVVSVALPQTHSTVSPPWTVDSEFIRYEEDGSSSIEMYTTSYFVDGDETLLSWALPGSPFKTAVGRVFEAIGPLFVSAERLKSEERIKRSHLRTGFVTRCNLGCLAINHAYFSKAERQWTGCAPGTVVGREQILGHPTEALQLWEPWAGQRRVTMWTAPDLACFALRITYEEQRPDGGFRLVSEKRALRMNLKP